MGGRGEKSLFCAIKINANEIGATHKNQYNSIKLDFPATIQL